MNPGVYSRERLLDASGFEPVDDVRKALKRTRQALNARTEDDEPDHAIRLKAASQVFAIAGVEAPKAIESAPGDRPINVAIVLTHAEPRAQVSTHGVVLHLSNGDGQSA